jgi:hypothetical protein
MEAELIAMKLDGSATSWGPWIGEHSFTQPFPKAKTVGKTYNFMVLRNERKYRRPLEESQLRP